MDGRVQECHRGRGSVGIEGGAEPPDGKHGRVVVQVQQADFVRFLAQYKKDRVKELDASEHKEPPDDFVDLEPHKSEIRIS